MLFVHLRTLRVFLSKQRQTEYERPMNVRDNVMSTALQLLIFAVFCLASAKALPMV